QAFKERAIYPLQTPFTRSAAALILPLALLIGLSHLLYGGDAVGDGFTGGVIGGLGVALWYIVFGYYDVKRRLPWLRPIRFLSAGLMLAVCNAALPLLLNEPFMHFIKF